MARVTNVRLPQFAIVEEAGEIDVALREILVGVGDAPQPHARGRAPGGEIGLIFEVEPHPHRDIDGGTSLVEEALLARQLVALQHHIGVQPADVGLAEAIVVARARLHAEVAHIIHDRPDVFEVMRRANAIVDRRQQQITRRIVAGKRQAGEIEQRMVEIPAMAAAVRT
ncbi:hypothetical protein ACMGDM_08255 [Sphingomonas sp. DT-51]|uniref:hypothetical protein n=1 Tax=Sphingomonas sp. DT-51 TaxID=3396165 RepID=UPI003F1A823F